MKGIAFLMVALAGLAGAREFTGKNGGGDAGFAAPPECYVLTLEHFPKALLDKIDGVIGGQFFVDHGAVLEYTGQKLWLKE